jgi:hypothetical protein
LKYRFSRGIRFRIPELRRFGRSIAERASAVNGRRARDFPAHYNYRWSYSTVRRRAVIPPRSLCNAAARSPAGGRRRPRAAKKFARDDEHDGAIATFLNCCSACINDERTITKLLVGCHKSGYVSRTTGHQGRQWLRDGGALAIQRAF